MNRNGISGRSLARCVNAGAFAVVVGIIGVFAALGFVVGGGNAAHGDLLFGASIVVALAGFGVMYVVSRTVAKRIKQYRNRNDAMLLVNIKPRERGRSLAFVADTFNDDRAQTEWFSSCTYVRAIDGLLVTYLPGADPDMAAGQALHTLHSMVEPKGGFGLTVRFFAQARSRASRPS